MKYTLVTFFALLLISFPDHSILQTGQEEVNPGKPVPITPLGPKPCPTCYQGRVSFTDSAISDSLRLVIRDTEAWRKVWERIYQTQSPTPPLPEIDFSREMLIVAALGGRPTGGYGIVVDRAYERGDRLEVIVRKQTPGKTCLNTQAVTHPVDIVRLPKTERSVVFRETEVAHVCK
jgi:hypothetical protein